MMRFPDKDRLALPPVFQETIPTTENKTGLWRFLTPVRKEKISSCRKSCPLENNIPGWMNKVREGDWEGAWSVMKEYNPFPAITGYTCYRFCEDKCSRGFWDEAVAIGEVEKSIGLWRHESYGVSGDASDNGILSAWRGESPEVAIVGSGPAGLSCAYYLTVLGARVTVLEKMPLAGGLLATGIPEYRLPRHILHKELEILRAEGIVIKTGFEVGKDISLNKLQEDFDAVLLAVGAQESKTLHIAGDDLAGVTGAVEFLRDIHLGRAGKLYGRVIVAGGGNAAVDAACAAALLGAEKVSLLYRRSSEEMPAHPDEINAARKAGVEFLFHTVLNKIAGQDKVQKVSAARVAPSRRGEALRTMPETNFDLDCDFLIMAIGQESGLSRLTSLSFSPDGAFKGGGVLFAAGDAIYGPSTVADAILSGRRAAISLAGALSPGEEVHKFPGIAPFFGGDEPVVEFDALNHYLFPKQSRLGTAEAEAGRCFSCGICNNCGVCWVFCPDLSIADNGDFEILLDYCKGCGICVRECPTGVLEMGGVNLYGA